MKKLLLSFLFVALGFLSGCGSKSSTPAVVNNSPVLTSIFNQTTNEDIAKAVTLSGSDADGDSLTYSATSDESNVTPSISGTTLTLTPTVNWSGSANITAKVNDGKIDSVTKTFTLTVSAVNDAPVIGDVSNQTTNEDTAKTINLSGSDIEGSSLTYSASSSTPNITISISSSTITLTPAANFNGNSTISIKTNDGAVDSAIKTFILTVSAVNDTPVVGSVSTQTTNEDIAKTVTLSGSDADGDSLTYSASSSSGSVTPSISGATLTLTPAANWNGNSTITIKANDGTLDSPTKTFTLTVSAVNDRPTLASISNQSTPENNVKAYTLVGADADVGDTLTYSATSTNSNVAPSISNTTLSLTPASAWFGTATITAKVNDGTVDSALQTFSITVVDVFNSGDNFNSKVYSAVTSPDTGRIWLDRNLGAGQVCTSSTDSDCYGYLYQWGRNDDGHESRTSSAINTVGSPNYRASSITPGIDKFIYRFVFPWDWTSVDGNGLLREAAWANAGANDICPVGYSVPTILELKADTTDASITNLATSFSSFLKLPAQGYRYQTSSSLADVGSDGHLWTRSLNSLSLPWSFAYGPSYSNVSWAGNNPPFGFGVRCIRDL